MRRIVTAGGVFFSLVALAPAQSTRVEDLAPGKLLVAPREALDPHFAETVVRYRSFPRWHSGRLGAIYRRNDLEADLRSRHIRKHDGHHG